MRVGPFPMISGVMIVKTGEKVQLVPDYKPTTLLYFTLKERETVGGGREGERGR